MFFETVCRSCLMARSHSVFELASWGESSPQKLLSCHHCCADNSGDLADHRLAEEGGLLGGVIPEHLRERKAMDTLQMETIHSDTTEDLCHVASVLESEFGIPPESFSLQDRQQVQQAD